MSFACWNISLDLYTSIYYLITHFYFTILFYFFVILFVNGEFANELSVLKLDILSW